MSLLNSDKSLVYQSDNDGSFPIHMAVTTRQLYLVLGLLKKCPDCAQLGDARGRTFFHIATQQGSTVLVFLVLSLLREKPRFASIINMQDNDGNTGLHLTVLARSLHTFLFMLWDKDVMLNLSNCEGKTAFDLAQSNIPMGVTFGLDPSHSIYSLLMVAGARYGAHSEIHDPVVLDKEKEEKNIMDSTPTISIVSALLVTVTFAASFTVPGGYRADDDPVSSHQTAGTPVLAATYSFQAFIIANNLALLCSSMATISLMYAGITTFDIGTRKCAFVFSIFFLNSSARSLAVAFAFGMYAALAPVAHAAAVGTWLIPTASLLDVVWFVCAFMIRGCVHMPTP
ncbi:protein ACCELERATED CELL DEATH 6-like [Lolium perenne]|uniref:protein ACCELERATED CELL DEATH 6-like n=1 Tax=Lolium perenne TaxID=4522 RepID=UPI0021EAE746|nr:protein ACCELERATED CELL DEATH 6-like [Lolium perenne]